MIVISCVDDNLGTMFNQRRQSRDRILIEHILKIASENRIWINSYSKELFKEAENVIVDEDFLSKAEDDDYCFVENVDLSGYEHKIHEIILYSWNRTYPSDKKININLDKWRIIAEENLEGSSHEKITQKIYIRRNK